MIVLSFTQASEIFDRFQLWLRFWLVSIQFRFYLILIRWVQFFCRRVDRKLSLPVSNRHRRRAHGSRASRSTEFSMLSNLEMALGGRSPRERRRSRWRTFAAKCYTNQSFLTWSSIRAHHSWIRTRTERQQKGHSTIIYQNYANSFFFNFIEEIS